MSSVLPYLAEPLPFPSGGGKSFIMGSDDVLESVLGLGDLADLTVSNDDADYGYDVSGPACLEFFLMMPLLTPSHSLSC